MKTKELIKEKTWCLLLEKGYDGVFGFGYLQGDRDGPWFVVPLFSQ